MGYVKSIPLALLGVVSVTAVAMSALVAAPAIAAVSVQPAPLSDASSAVSESAASVLARSFQHSVTVSSETTETTLVTALPNGTMSLESSTVPVRVQRAGSWVPVDLTLGASSAGMVAPAASAIPMKFSAGGTTLLDQVATSSGQWLTETWPLGTLPKPTLSGPKATYVNVLPGVDLVLTATVTGMSEVLVVKNATAANNPKLATLSVQVSGASVAPGANGSVVATATDGSTLTSAQPVWWDSTDADSSTAGPGGMEFVQPVAHSVSGNALSMNALAVTTAPKVTYPVYIDPDWGNGSNTGWYIDEFKPGNSYVNGTTMKVGYATAADSSDNIQHYTESFWKIDTSAIVGKHVSASHFDTLETYSGNYYCATRNVTLSRVDQPNGYTWYSGTPSSSVAQDTVNTAHRGTAACPAADVTFSTLEAAQHVADNSMGSLTLMASASTTDDVAWKQFAVGATFYATYNSPPNTPTGATFTAPHLLCGTSATTPAYANNVAGPLTMQVNATDPDAANQVSTAFSLVDGHTLTPVTSYTSPFLQQGLVQWQLAKGTLASGLYAWRAQTSDGMDSSGNSTYCYIQIENTGPGLPTVAKTSTPAAVVGQPSTFTLTGTASTALFGYWWTDGSVVSPSPLPGETVAPLDPTTGRPNCAAAPYNGEQFVCAGANQRANITSAPIDAPHATLWVVAYDGAGNLSTNLTTPSNTSRATGLGLTTKSDIIDVQYSASGGDMWRAGAILANDESMVNQNSKHQTSVLALSTPSMAIKAPKSSAPVDTRVLALSGEVAFSTYSYPASNTFVSSTSWGVPTGGTSPVFLGWLKPAPNAVRQPAPPAGMTVLYDCTSASGAHMSSISATCDGTGMTASPIGYLWKTVTSTTNWVTPLSRCGLSGIDVVGGSKCAVGQVATWLGYIDLGQEKGTESDSTVIGNSLASGFTYSAWVDENPAAADFSTTPTNETLFDYNGVFSLKVAPDRHWQLCWSGGSSASSCTTGQAVTSGQWHFVSVIWDPANQQLRLVVDGHITAALVVSSQIPSGVLTSTHKFTLGAAGDGSGQSWRGYIDDVSAFPGVASTSQLTRLMSGKAPQ
ncbi:MAG: hypothetical protein JWN80_2456 [Microbacteriaceae bacterium]|jgi:hypothetical protein|nr:hypothetical protein [Microbacteriaceae bacterium]